MLTSERDRSILRHGMHTANLKWIEDRLGKEILWLLQEIIFYPLQDGCRCVRMMKQTKTQINRLHNLCIYLSVYIYLCVYIYMYVCR